MEIKGGIVMETKEAISRLQTLLDTEISLQTKQAIAMGIASLKTNLKEQSEVDLKEEYKEYVEDDPVFSKLTNRNVGLAIARHFYELGLKAKEEK